MSRKDNRSYYDDFANWYEKERHDGYHALIDQLQIEVAAPFAQDQDILEIGCGTGMILKELDPLSKSAVGIDISPGMLKQAQARGLNVVVGSATDLPFEEASFDFICSFKVLAHIEDITKTMSEVSRVLRPGGRAALEFYNKKSIRSLIKHLKKPHQISENTHDEEVYTRYDHLDDVKGYLPDDLQVVDLRGVRVFTPFAQVHKVPGVKTLFSVAERFARDQKYLAQFGGFMIVIVEKQNG